MIQIIDIFPYINKIVRGELDDAKQFHPEKTTYRVDNVGLKTGRYLIKTPYDYMVYGLLDKKMSDFEKEIQPFCATYMDFESELRISLVHEEDIFQLIEGDAPTISMSHQFAFQSIVNSKIREDDEVILIEQSGSLDIKLLNDFYTTCKEKQCMVVCDLNEIYWKMLEDNPANVFVLNLKQLENHYNINEYLNDSKIIELVKKDIMKYAGIIILSIKLNQFIIFTKEEVYQATYPFLDKKYKYFNEAVLSAVITCFKEHGNIQNLSEQLLANSIGESLSNGLYVPSEEAKRLIKEKVIVSKIGE